MSKRSLRVLGLLVAEGQISHNVPQVVEGQEFRELSVSLAMTRQIKVNHCSASGHGEFASLSRPSSTSGSCGSCCCSSWWWLALKWFTSACDGFGTTMTSTISRLTLRLTVQKYEWMSSFTLSRYAHQASAKKPKIFIHLPKSKSLTQILT